MFIKPNDTHDLSAFDGPGCGHCDHSSYSRAAKRLQSYFKEQDVTGETASSPAPVYEFPHMEKVC